MPTATYETRRLELETYFDRTAVEAWKRLTSDAAVSGIRATVRAGRERMRATLLAALPHNLAGARLLDAGCGTGALAVEAARRGAHVVAVDVSPKLVKIAHERLPDDLVPAAIDWRVGDMLDPALGRFDFIVAMDSLIHYRAADIGRILGGFAQRTGESIHFTFAPRTPALALMHTVGKIFPRGDRAPAIEPASERDLRTIIAHEPDLTGWEIAGTTRINSKFYTSQAMELGRR